MGDGELTVTARGTGNYSGEVNKTFAIAKATAPNVSNIAREHNKGSATAGASIDLAALLPNNCGITGCNLSKSGDAVTSGAAVNANGIVSYAISDRPTLSMVTKMLDMAVAHIPDDGGLILHSD